MCKNYKKRLKAGSHKSQLPGFPFNAQSFDRLQERYADQSCYYKLFRPGKTRQGFRRWLCGKCLLNEEVDLGGLITQWEWNNQTKWKWFGYIIFPVQITVNFAVARGSEGIIITNNSAGTNEVSGPN